MKNKNINFLLFILLLFLPQLLFSDFDISTYNSQHYNGEEFINEVLQTNNLNFEDYMKFAKDRDKRKWPDSVKIMQRTNKFKDVRSGEGIQATFVGHDTVLLQFDNINILTDPIWTERASPVSWVGPKRSTKPAISFNSLPHIHMILISHNHYDHMNIPTIKKLVKKYNPIIYAGLNSGRYFRKEKIKNFIEMDWWQTNRYNDDVLICYAPAQHFSMRGLFDRDETLWGSFFIKSRAGSIYFAGDTGLGPHFKQIYDKWGAPDLSLLPIGAYQPRWFMKYYHMNPDDAVQSHLLLKSKKSIGIHFKTFPMANDRYEEPVIDLKKAIKKYNVLSNTFIAPHLGDTIITFP